MEFDSLASFDFNIGPRKSGLSSRYLYAKKNSRQRKLYSGCVFVSPQPRPGRLVRQGRTVDFMAVNSPLPTISRRRNHAKDCSVLTNGYSCPKFGSDQISIRTNGFLKTHTLRLALHFLRGLGVRAIEDMPAMRPRNYIPRECVISTR